GEVECVDALVAPVGDEHVAAVGRDPARILELAGAGAGDTGLAALGADLVGGAAVGDTPAPRRDEVAAGVELLDPVVLVVGDEHRAVSGVDSDRGGEVQLAGPGAVVAPLGD